MINCETIKRRDIERDAKRILKFKIIHLILKYKEKPRRKNSGVCGLGFVDLGQRIDRLRQRRLIAKGT